MGLRFYVNSPDDTIQGSYEIGFKRAHRTVSVRDKVLEGVFHSKTSKHPYTTATLYKLELEPSSTRVISSKVVATSTVGCADVDPFSKESGRVFALKGLNPKVNRDVRHGMWTCYMGRTKRTLRGPKGNLPPVENQLHAAVEHLTTLEVLTGQTIH